MSIPLFHCRSNAHLIMNCTINDLPNISKVLAFYLFADDTNMYHEAESPEKLESITNKELKLKHMPFS